MFRLAIQSVAQDSNALLGHASVMISVVSLEIAATTLMKYALVSHKSQTVF